MRYTFWSNETDSVFVINCLVLIWITNNRVTLPLSVAEFTLNGAEMLPFTFCLIQTSNVKIEYLYEVAQLFCVAEASKDNTGGGEGIEVLKNEPFDNHPLLGGQYSKGQYTYKIYHIASKVPAFIRIFLPKGSLEVHEEAWNAYPYCRTVITNPLFLGQKFTISIDSMHLKDVGNSENVHQLPPEKLKHRDVVHIDIANDKIEPRDYIKHEDPTLFHSQKTGRGPLVGKWQEQAKPVMTCYKLVTCEFKWFGLQNRVEEFIQSSERRLFTTFHRKVFCSIDRWYGLTMADIRALEEKTKHELDKQRHQGEVRGLKADAD
ncbi:hypothetical protein RUM43_010120 [Polyplax serrata]|uniref:Phosphatidylinositol transfer protein N-terminal domain-containing protein n=1 Tax=Polyplax serrata TaxID=468196 RepID=A0AAN8S4P0_POLSC